MNTYLAIWRDKQVQVEALSTYAAQKAALPLLQAGARVKVQQSDVRVWLAAKDGEPVVHVADF